MENATRKYSKKDAPVYACKVLPYLISQPKMSFAEMRDLLGISHNGNWYAVFLAYIVDGIKKLKKEWGEDIPPITALVFKNGERATEWSCQCLTGNPEQQPTSQQIENLKADVAAYDKWDKVLEYFRNDSTM